MLEKKFAAKSLLHVVTISPNLCIEKSLQVELNVLAVSHCTPFLSHLQIHRFLSKNSSLHSCQMDRQPSSSEDIEIANEQCLKAFLISSPGILLGVFHDWRLRIRLIWIHYNLMHRGKNIPFRRQRSGKPSPSATIFWHSDTTSILLNSPGPLCVSASLASANKVPAGRMTLQTFCNSDIHNANVTFVQDVGGCSSTLLRLDLSRRRCCKWTLLERKLSSPSISQGCHESGIVLLL
jgi:hypothetical protein